MRISGMSVTLTKCWYQGLQNCERTNTVLDRRSTEMASQDLIEHLMNVAILSNVAIMVL